MLDARRSHLNSSYNSVVQFATRKSQRGRHGRGGGLLKRAVVSPVVVRLAGAVSKGEGTAGGRQRKWSSEGDHKLDGEFDERDPCDKEVVLNALRQKR